MSARLCVICRREPVQPTWDPFCSERCKLLDLARWINGTYRVPAEPVPADPDDVEDADESDQSKSHG